MAAQEKKDYKHILAFTITVIIFAVLSKTVFRFGGVSGDSMYPTLNDKEITLRVTSKLMKYKRGDIVVINSSTANDVLIKRVIAVPGDILKMDEDTVYLNGKKLDEPYVNREFLFGYTPMELKIPNGYVYVLGDNRAVSLDSRTYGLIPEEEIKEIVIMHFR